jgi:hypothetical protein
MKRIVFKARIDKNGVLNLTLPMGPSEADQEVQVTVEPVSPPVRALEEWRQQILATAGKWQGDFERPS